MGKKSRRRDRNTAAARPARAARQSIQQRPVAPGPLMTGEALKNPYVVRRDDFRRLIRWPNDGIEQERKKNLEGGPDCLKSVESDDPDTMAMNDLLGGYPSESANPPPLSETEPEGGTEGEPFGFIRSLPFLFQQKAAKEQSNLSLAKSHLVDAYKSKNDDVRRILKEINCEKSVYKASCDVSRFPDFRMIIVPLFQRNLASDENIELLFGKVSHVRHILLETGAELASPPPADSPAGAFLSQFLYVPDLKATPAPKSCAECGLKSDDCLKCVCKTVAYCNASCQKKHWRIHKPDCLRAQGKDVPDKVAAEAKRKIEEKAALEKRRIEEEREQVAKQFMKHFEDYASEGPGEYFAHDCCGKKLQMYVPTVYADQMIGMIGNLYLQLEQVQIVSLGMYPKGIDPDKYGFRDTELKDKRNGARILVLFERLFSDGGNGVGVGLHIDGVFVVEKVVSGKARWKQVPEPKVLYASNDNRLNKLVKYLGLAKGEAKSVPNTVDLGIHNPGDPDLTMLTTQFGDYVSVK